MAQYYESKRPLDGPRGTMYNVLHMAQTPEITSGLNLNELYKTPVFWGVLVFTIYVVVHAAVGAIPTTVETK